MNEEIPMTTTPRALRAARQKSVTTPNGCRFTIRKLSPFDVLACGGNADLSALARADEKSLAADGALREACESFAVRILARALVGMRLLMEEKKTYAEDELFAGDLPSEDLLSLFSEVLAWSGLTKEAAHATRPFSTTNGDSFTSTPSPAAMEPARAASWNAEAIPSSDTPSTPHAPAPGSPQKGGGA